MNDELMHDCTPKMCSKCGDNPRQGKSPWCAPCKRAYNRAYRVDHLEQCRDADRRRWEKQQEANLSRRIPQDKNADVKVCTRCQQVKPIGEFYRMRSGYPRGTCKSCVIETTLEYQKAHRPLYAKLARRSRRNNPTAAISHRLKYRYGITHSEYEAMVEQQNGVCAICGSSPKEGKKLVVDHDHATGHVRGLLCNSCNQLLGAARDDEVILTQAITYLRLQREDYERGRRRIAHRSEVRDGPAD